uniref:Uncharacterized protein n=1 Tax=Ciona savignyi TaxID=51511 RepID=H2Z0U2_CIOSA
MGDGLTDSPYQFVPRTPQLLENPVLMLTRTNSARSTPAQASTVVVNSLDQSVPRTPVTSSSRITQAQTTPHSVKQSPWAVVPVNVASSAEHAAIKEKEASRPKECMQMVPSSPDVRSNESVITSQNKINAQETPEPTTNDAEGLSVFLFDTKSNIWG